MAPYAQEKTSYGEGQSYAVVIVDPYSTGCLVAQEVAKRGYNLVAVWSKDITPEMKTHVPRSCDDLFYYAEIDERSGETIAETAAAVRNAAPFDVIACICGGDTGVTLTDALSEELGLRTNGTKEVPQRRDKKIQQERTKMAGLRSVHQAGGTDISDVEEFLRTEQYPLVVKPTESAGSDGVKLCNNFEEAKDHFNLLMNSQRRAGSVGAAVLCQEFLRGKEYVVDHVSCDGVHKATMVWVYDKRPVNGAAFVYFGLLPVDSNSEEAKIVVPYVRGVLDALAIQNGPTHSEVMMTSDGPCLVEVNCRAHGGDGNWVPLVRALNGGYSQVEATVDAYLYPENFHRLPDLMPSPFKASGQEITLVSFSKGKVQTTPGFDVMKKLPSFVSLETRVDVGSEVDYTIDLFTDLGSVILMHHDEDVVKRDVQFIRYLEEINGFFNYEKKSDLMKRPRGEDIYLDSVDELKPLHRVYSLPKEGPGLLRTFSNDRPELRPMLKRMTTIDASNEAVIIVDPYSTGALISKEISNRTYNVIALWSKDLPSVMRKDVPTSCGNIRYLAELTEKGSLADTAKAIEESAKSFRVVACLAGGEAGVVLADSLSEKLGVRTNGTDIPNRCDKKMQQELVKKAGLRSVRQAGGDKFSDVEAFLNKEPYPVVVKPVESAGSDGVKLCHNFNEAKEHFSRLMKSQMVNGGSCAAVLCQEYLRGKEYVVDQVSRDGVHKTTMVWVYDKRQANGAPFVYFGCIPVDSESPEAKLLIPYMRGVLDALGIKNGATHGEAMMTPSGPCLVEMNCRAHGGDGNWVPLVRALNGGFSQVDAAVDSYLDQKQFFNLPDKMPSPFKAFGQEVILVSYSRGTVKACPGFDLIKDLDSFVYLETGVRVGSKVERTVDLFTCIGSVILMHHDKDIVAQDINTVRKLESDNKLFEYEAAPEIMKSPSFNDLIAFSELGVATNKATGHRRIISSDRADLYF